MHDELRDALRRVDPPAGFANRVLERANRLAKPEPASPKPARWFTTRVKAGAIAATLVVAITGGLWYRAEERRKEGEEAKRQVLLSLSITAGKLKSIESKINHGEEH